MKTPWALMLAIACVAFAPSSANCQNYPSKTITLVVPFAAGGVTDIMARVAAQQISSQSGQSVVVENRPAASGNVGTHSVARAPADGYTIGLVTSNLLITNPSFYPDMAFDPLQDLIPVGTIGEFPQMLIINAQVAAKTLGEFIALAKKSPNKLTFGSGGRGSTSYLAVHTFAHLTGIQLVHVPYRGMAPAFVDLLAGRVQIIGSGLAVVNDHLPFGKIRVLAVGSRERLPQLPDVPTGEQAGVPGWESNAWSGIVAPKNTPKDIVARLNGYLASISSDPAARKLLESAYIAPLTMSAQDLARTIEREKAAWDKMKSSGIDLN